MQKIKTIEDTRQSLSEIVYRLGKQPITAQNCNAMTNAIGKMLSSVRLEMDYHKMIDQDPKIAFINAISQKKELKRIRK